MKSAKCFAITLIPLVLLATACSAEEMTGMNPDGVNPGVADEVNTGVTDRSDIPAVMQNLGFSLADFDPATGFAGDLKISGVMPPVAADNDPNKGDIDRLNRYLMSLYGMEQPDGRDVQMSFYLPLGTPVISMVSGTVCDVPQLYSDDFSVRVAPDGVACEAQGRASVLFETEHVINPLVQVGDTVTAGQVVAEVSDYTASWKDVGLGIVEIGVFFSKQGDGQPWHACPLEFIDPQQKEKLLGSLATAYAAWERELGDPTLYDEDAELPGCATLDDITDDNNRSTNSSNDG